MGGEADPVLSFVASAVAEAKHSLRRRLTGVDDHPRPRQVDEFLGSELPQPEPILIQGPDQNTDQCLTGIVVRSALSAYLLQQALAACASRLPGHASTVEPLPSNAHVSFGR